MFSYNPELTVLDGDINADGAGDGVVLDLINTNPAGTGNISVEGFHIKNGFNSVDDGGCIRVGSADGSTSIIGNIISNCAAVNAAGIGVQTDSGAIDIIHNIIYDNIATDYSGGIGAVTTTGTITILNNTVTGNTGGITGGIAIVLEDDGLGTAADANIQNNIIWGNSGTIPDVGTVMTSVPPGTGTTYIWKVRGSNLSGYGKFSGGRKRLEGSPLFI